MHSAHCSPTIHEKFIMRKFGALWYVMHSTSFKYVCCMFFEYLVQLHYAQILHM